MKRHIPDAVVYTAGRLAERKENLRFSWYKLVFKAGSYIYVCGYLSLIQSGLVSNKPRFTALTILLALLGFIWETYGFFKGNRAKNDDQKSVLGAGYQLIGTGTDHALIYAIDNIVVFSSIKKLSKRGTSTIHHS